MDHWIWTSTGKNGAYTNWQPRQPYNGRCAGQNANDQFWLRLTCSSENGFVCEKGMKFITFKWCSLIWVLVSCFFFFIHLVKTINPKGRVGSISVGKPTYTELPRKERGACKNPSFYEPIRHLDQRWTFLPGYPLTLSILAWQGGCTCSTSISHPGIWYKACLFHVSALHWWDTTRPNQRSLFAVKLINPKTKASTISIPLNVKV